LQAVNRIPPPKTQAALKSSPRVNFFGGSFSCLLFGRGEFSPSLIVIFYRIFTYESKKKTEKRGKNIIDYGNLVM